MEYNIGDIVFELLISEVIYHNIITIEFIDNNEYTLSRYNEVFDKGYLDRNFIKLYDNKTKKDIPENIEKVKDFLIKGLNEHYALTKKLRNISL
jgi:hypothetical protein